SQPTGNENTTAMRTPRNASSTTSCASQSAATPAALARRMRPTCTARRRSAMVSTGAVAYAVPAPHASVHREEWPATNGSSTATGLRGRARLRCFRRPGELADEGQYVVEGERFAHHGDHTIHLGRQDESARQDDRNRRDLRLRRLDAQELGAL